MIGIDAADVQEVGFIVRKGEWEAKDVDMDRFISIGKAKDGVLDVYLLEKDPNIYYAEEDVDLSPKILKAELTTVNKIRADLSIPMTLLHDQNEGLTIKSGEEEVEIQTIYFSEGGRPETSTQLEILLAEPLTLGKTYTLSKEGYGEKDIMMSGVFSTKAFENAYHYDGELGAVHEPGKTTFRLWAPTATSVALNLFTSGNEGEAYETINMEKKERGVWETEVREDLHGVYYTYSVENLGVIQEAVDPYARAVGVNGLRGMVVDLDKTDPLGWSEDSKPEFKEGLIEMRKNHPAFHMDSADEIREHLSFIDMPKEKMVGYRLDGAAVGDSWSEIIVLMNAGTDSVSYTVEGSWDIMVNGEKAGTAPLASIEGEVEVPEQTLMVLAKSAGETPSPAEGEKTSDGQDMMLIIILILGAGLAGYIIYKGRVNRKAA
ncbi:hypothetical protein [Proteiniclasticum sp.]|uniref:hypothetical protein n=1 Tax=Proteiniclasticum sp. TaxID=2053595 RepID=UPI0028A1902D|nr:hypothetical protein [Proteiniclasticum sp.]